MGASDVSGSSAVTTRPQRLYDAAVPPVIVVTLKKSRREPLDDDAYGSG